MNSSSTVLLLAEDEDFLARSYKNRFTLEGFDVHVACDGKEAIEMIASLKPDIVLLDLIMPKMNGFEVLEHVKQQDETKDIPVIVTSNLGQDSDIEKAKNLGAIDYIVKSNTSMKDLISKVYEHIQK